MSEHRNQYIVLVWHDFNCIDRYPPPHPPQIKKKSFLHDGGGKILCDAISRSFNFKLVKS